MATVTVNNTDAQLSAHTLATTDTAQSVTALKTFSLSPSAPFAVDSGSAVVTNLDANKLQGNLASAFLLLTGGTMVGNLLFTDNTYDIGASGATRPRDLFLARNLVVAGTTKFNGGTYTWPAADGTASYYLQTNGSGTLSWATPGSMILLKAGSGTTTNAAAENVDTYAMASGLTAKDTLIYFVSVESVTQNTAQVFLYNSTDAVNIQAVSLSPLAAGRQVWIDGFIRQLQSASGSFVATRKGTDDVGGTYDDGTKTSNATGWTGAWTLALRHGGVTGGGTMKWSWSVYKLAGQ